MVELAQQMCRSKREWKQQISEKENCSADV